VKKKIEETPFVTAVRKTPAGRLLCRQGFTPVRESGDYFTMKLPTGATLHIAGYAKGCDEAWEFPRSLTEKVCLSVTDEDDMHLSGQTFDGVPEALLFLKYLGVKAPRVKKKRAKVNRIWRRK
jgi:hypothetical protein